MFDGVGVDGVLMSVKLFELFEFGKPSLVIYNFMFLCDPVDVFLGLVIGETALLLVKDGLCFLCIVLFD